MGSEKIANIIYDSLRNKNVFEFCNDILSKGLSYKDIMFTDETKIELGNYTHDFIRLSPQTHEQLKKGEEEAYNLVNRPQRKFEKSLMLVGGISYHGLTKLIILEGTLNEFSYGQGLLFYKDDINSFNLKHNSDICLDQAGAPTHRCKSNIENIWGIIKQRVKRGIRNFSRVKTIFS